MATTPFNPKYRPIRTFTHATLGRVDEYALRRFRSDGSGAQARFLRNNARPNRKCEYGIKLFNTPQEAFAAFQRQKIAADAGLAPPVRRMVKVSVEQRLRFNPYTSDLSYQPAPVVYWGYQTCIAYGIGKIDVPYEYDGETDVASIRNAWGMDAGVRRMYLALVQLSIAGTQRGDRVMGRTYGRRAPRMCHDLHCENIGFWRKRPVVIDFGGHLVEEAC
jgi:hypothetical protein